jgi:hypothetical protein
LYKIQEKEMKQIVTWIERFGVTGYITFEDDVFKISDSDPKDQAEEKKRVRPVSLEQ